MTAIAEIDLEGLEEMVRSYLYCALWTTSRDGWEEDGGSEFLDGKYGVEDFEEEAVSKAHDTCRKFAEDNGEDLAMTGASWDQHGHDLWLTRNGHGVGFWDRGYGEVGERLTEAAHKLGEIYAWETGNGKVYIE